MYYCIAPQKLKTAVDAVKMVKTFIIFINESITHNILHRKKTEVIKKRLLRVYARVIKRRPKSYPRMNQSRQDYVKSMVSGK